MHCIDKKTKKSWADTENAVEKFRCGGFTSLYTHINYIETTCYTIITRLIKMNDAELAQRYLKMRENTKAANKRYLATEHGRLKCRVTQRNNYHSHTGEEGYLEKRRETAKLFYENNEAYRENRKVVARAKYQLKKSLGEKSETATN